MFVDKSTPSTVTVARVSRFFSANGVKNSDTLATVDSSAQFNQQLKRPQIAGYIIRMQTATGTWYQNGRSTAPSVMGWTQEVGKSWIYPSRLVGDPAAEKETKDIRALLGDQAIVAVALLPVCMVPIGRCEIIDEEQS